MSSKENEYKISSKNHKISKKRIVYYTFIIIFMLLSNIYVVLYVPLGSYNLNPEVLLNTGSEEFSYYVPLDPNSPWPKFRANSLGNGRSVVTPQSNPDAIPWSFKTGKGIFSSPVVDADGTVYVGSADHIFYSIYKNGSVKWMIKTDEIIDSAALLDDLGRVYFGSGDTHIYAVNRETGDILWKFKAHTVAEAEEQYGLELNNINWFEGNIAMLPDGSIIAPNDNQILYRLDRENGAMLDVYLGNEMLWSLPAINPKTERLFFGTTNFALKTVYAYDYHTGKEAWTAGGFGSVAASPLLTSTRENGAIIVGGYDGFLRAYTQRNGKQLWSFGTNDHIYSSPGQLSDGTIIQPSADGTVYAIDTEGRSKWRFDTFEPIRSSPAIDGNDIIYVGSGDGKLYAINPDGTLRWSYQLSLSDRNDLNSSPALGKEGIYIASQNGEIYYVPYDYPLSSTGRNDPRSTQGQGESLPKDGVFLLYTSPFGKLYYQNLTTIALNQPLTFSLFVRDHGNNIASEIDVDSLSVEVEGTPDFDLYISGNRRFFTIVPQEKWGQSEALHVSVTGKYKTGMNRIGLKFFWGHTTGNLNSEFIFSPQVQSNIDNPFQAPNLHEGNSSVFEFIRAAVPLPRMLPSYNQIGFDSLHYIAGIVEARSSNSMLVWVIPGKYSENGTLVNPELRERFPMILEFDNGLITFHNYDGFKINFIGAWDMPFASYRISTTYNITSKTINSKSALFGNIYADEIDFYGTGLKLSGLSDWSTGEMLVSGAINVNKWQEGVISDPGGIGDVTYSQGRDYVKINLVDTSLVGNQHVYSILMVDNQGNALPLYYSAKTKVVTNSDGQLDSVRLSFSDSDNVSGEIKVYLMVDTYPVSSQIMNFD